MNKQDLQKQISKMNTDARILRYLVVDADIVHSTAVRDALGCHYIYVKPGMADGISGVSNIDFVQTVYAQHGIMLKKHKSHLDGKEIEVLYMSVSDVIKLPKIQQWFLDKTAPRDYSHCSSSDGAQSRAVDIYNKIFHQLYPHGKILGM